MAFGIDFDSIHGKSHGYLEKYENFFRYDPNRTREQVLELEDELTKVFAKSVISFLTFISDVYAHYPRQTRSSKAQPQ